MKEASKTKVITCPVLFSFLHVFEPYAMSENDAKKYSAQLIIDKSEHDTIAKIKEAIKAAIEEGAGILNNAKKGLKIPLRDGDVDREGNDIYAGKYFIDARSKNKPGIVDANLNPLLDREELYSGCIGRASITFYAFNKKGNKGIACGLQNLMKLEDGERLAKTATPEKDFADFAEDYAANFSNTANEFDDLLG